MGNILLKGVRIEDRRADIHIVGKRISRIAPSGTIAERDADKVIDCKRLAAIPGFVNLHTHASMTLMRGVSEDAPLKEWLDRVWRIEAFLDHDSIYWGTKLAILEMLKTGTTSYLDMYWMADQSVRAAEEMGIRACLTYNFLDNFDSSIAEKQRRDCQLLHDFSKTWSNRVRFGVSVHADYTTSEDTIRWAKNFANDNGCIYTAHLGETASETEDDLKKYGMTPTEHFDRIEALDSDTILAHALWLTEKDIDILSKRGVTVVHNINSNLKLASGYRFQYNELRDAGVNVCLGTDGTASSNNLDIREAMKTMALVQKAWRKDPKAMPLDELMAVATSNGARALKLDTGRLEEGALADIVLVNTSSEAFVPNFNFISNLVYSANSSCFDTVIIDGRIVMEGRKVPGEEEILEKAEELAWKLFKMN